MPWLSEETMLSENSTETQMRSLRKIKHEAESEREKKSPLSKN